MGERLDLSRTAVIRGYNPYEAKTYQSIDGPHTVEEVLAEALRAQASEDALKKRVRVLEIELARKEGTVIVPTREEMRVREKSRLRVLDRILQDSSEIVNGGKGEG